MRGGLVLGAWVLLAGTMTACSSKFVVGEAPFVQVTSWQLDGRRLLADLRIRNVNDEPLPVTGIKLTVKVQQDTLLMAYDGPHETNVSANGFETVSLNVQAPEEGTRLLEALQAGEIPSLPYDLSGHVLIRDGKSLPIMRKGHIYTVPGRPGHFR